MREQLKQLGLNETQSCAVMSLIAREMITRRRFNQVNERRKTAELRKDILEEKVRKLEREVLLYGMMKQELRLLKQVVKDRKEQAKHEQRKLMLDLMDCCIHEEALKQKIRTCMNEEEAGV